MADPDDLLQAGSVYVIFGSAGGGEGWGASIDLDALDGNNGFVVPGVVAGGHFG